MKKIIFGLFVFGLFLIGTNITIAASNLSSVSTTSQSGILIAGAVNSATYNITVNRTGNGLLNVSLGISSILPSGVTASFNPTSLSFTGNSPTFQTSTLTLTTTNESSSTITNFTIQAVGDTTKTTTGILTINPDLTPPTLNLPSNITKEATSSTGAITDYTVSADDINPTHPAVSCTPTSGSIFPLGNTTVNCSATDVAGNTTNGSFSINVQDTTAPTSSLSFPLVNSILSGIIELTANANDLVEVSKVEFWHSSVPITKIGEDDSSPYSFNWDTTSVIDGLHNLWLDAYDAIGNHTQSELVSVKVDNNTPIIIAPVDQTFEATGPLTTPTLIEATATDNVDPNPKIIYSPTEFPLGENTVTWTATDEAGFTSTTTSKVIIEDKTAPIIILDGSNPQNILVNESYTELGATVTDIHDVELTPTIDSSSVDTSVLGTYYVKYNAIDISGNKAEEAIRTVNIVDQDAPIITLEGANPQIIEVHSSYTELGAEVSDNFDTGLAANIDTSTVNLDLLGSYSVIYNAVDSSGNKAEEAIRTINIVDTTDPVITLNGDNPINLKVGDNYTEPGAIVNDNYDTEFGKLEITGTVDTNTSGTYTLTYSVSDSSGNSTSVTRNVIVRNLGANSALSSLSVSLGTLSPTFNEETADYIVILPYQTSITPETTAIPVDEFANIEISNATDITSIDIANRTTTITVKSENKEFTNIYTIIFNVSNKPDTTNPVITLLGNAIVNITVGDTYNDAGATADDDIDGNITSKIETKNNVNTAIAGEYIVTYDVSDSAGNEANQISRKVNVVERPRNSTGSYLPGFGPRVLGAQTGGQVLGEEKFIFTQFMKRGMKGGEIDELQRFLNDKGYSCGAVDGIFGIKTENCVKEFQKANPPLRVDGIVGPKTREVLNK